MKRGTIEHPKLLHLVDLLGVSQVTAVGALECLWHFTARYAIEGDIGKHSDVAIARGCHWTDGAEKFVRALVDAGWLDEDSEHRLLVHDWPVHADQSTKKTIQNRHLSFFHPSGRKVSIQPVGKEKSGSGSGTGSGKAQAQAQAGQPIGDPVTSADRHEAGPLYERLKAVVPSRRRPGARKIRDALVTCLQDGANGEKVIAAAARYYKTKHSRGQYGWGLASFLLDGHYDDDEAAWQASRGIDHGAGTTPKSSQRLAAQRAEDRRIRDEQAADPDGFAQAQRGGSQ